MPGSLLLKLLNQITENGDLITESGSSQECTMIKLSKCSLSPVSCTQCLLLTWWIYWWLFWCIKFVFYFLYQVQCQSVSVMSSDMDDAVSAVCEKVPCRRQQAQLLTLLFGKVGREGNSQRRCFFV